MIKISQDDWIQYFPFKSPREEQIKAINFILESFLNGKKYVICSAATGIGKSIIGVTVSRYLRSHYQHSNIDNLDPSIGTFILTSQKVLQQQYIDDFGGSEPTKLKSIKSSTSYICQMHKDAGDQLSCGEVHRLMAANSFFKILYEPCVCKCHYKQEKQVFLNSLECVTNYSYFFAESQYAKGIQKRELIICDEAHGVEEQLGKFVEISISERFASTQLGLKMPPDFKDMNAAYTWIKSKYKPALKIKLGEVATILGNLKDAANKIKSLQEHAQRHDLLDKHLCKINRFIDAYSVDNWVFNLVPANGKSQRKIEFKPVDISHFSQDHLFNFADKILFLSATIFDKDIFCRSLGIDKNEATFIRLPSPFKIQNRLVQIMPVGSMGKKSIEDTLPRMRDAIKIILEEHKEEKGVLHTCNFRITNYLLENIDNPRLVTHDSTNRDLILKLHGECKKPSVLVSPSMMEGVDLTGDKSRFQIICKIPFPFLGDQVVQKRMKLDPSWYSYKTMITFIQAIGRSVRTADDYAMTYVLDSDWNLFYRTTKNIFPQEIVD